MALMRRRTAVQYVQPDRGREQNCRRIFSGKPFSARGGNSRIAGTEDLGRAMPTDSVGGAERG